MIEPLENLNTDNPIQQLANNDDDDNMNIMPDISNLVDESPNQLPMTLQNDLSAFNEQNQNQLEQITDQENQQQSFVSLDSPPVNPNPNLTIKELN